MSTYTRPIETEFIPNTAVFGPTNFIGTTIASTTTRMTVYALEDFYYEDDSLCTGRFLRWSDGESALKRSEDRCYKKSHRIAKCGSI